MKNPDKMSERELRLEVKELRKKVAGSIPFFGIWNEAWQACLRVHKIDFTFREEERAQEAAKDSYYNPTVPEQIRELRQKLKEMGA